ncbi:MAG: hypothetical protein AAF802_08630 [Planctomycetota bacterium]
MINSATDRGAGTRREFCVAVLVFAVPFVLAHLVFHELHAFPHNDDFLYARCSEILVNEGEYRHVSQQGRLAASVASHCVWGALFCTPFGFSYDALHVSVTVAAWLGALSVWSVGRRLGGSNLIATLSGLTMCVGPFYFGMSFTFMTDVTALAFVALALAAYARGALENSTWSLFLGAFMATLATWARQTHLLVVVVPLVTHLGIVWRSNPHGRVLGLAVTLCISVGIPIAGYVLFETGWIVPGNEERMEIVDVAVRDWAWLKHAFLFAYGGGLLLGLVTIPIALICLAQRHAENGGRAFPWFGIIVSGIWSVLFIVSGGRAYVTQATGYILYNAHLGPVLLGDQNDPGRWSDLGGVAWPAWIWQLVTIASITSFGVISQVMFRAITSAIGNKKAVGSVAPQDEVLLARRMFAAGLSVMVLVSAAALLWLVEMIYDRYWLLCYPAVFSLMAALKFDLSRARLATSLWLAALFFSVSFVFTHDLLAWNDTRRIQVKRWLEKGLEPRDFDAGNGVNGWFRSAEDEQTLGRPGDETPFWRGHARQMLAIGPRDGWQTADELKWSCWAVRKPCSLYVLKRARLAEPE